MYQGQVARKAFMPKPLSLRNKVHSFLQSVSLSLSLSLSLSQFMAFPHRSTPLYLLCLISTNSVKRLEHVPCGLACNQTMRCSLQVDNDSDVSREIIISVIVAVGVTSTGTKTSIPPIKLKNLPSLAASVTRQIGNKMKCINRNNASGYK